jgi:hypothetical protein
MRAAIHSGDFGRAKALCEALLREYPDYVGALQTLGVIHQSMNDPHRCLRLFRTGRPPLSDRLDQSHQSRFD